MIGVNIARAGRTETYAVPSEAVLSLLDDLKSGKLAPKEDKKPEAEAKLTEAKAAFEKAEAERVAAEKKAAEAKTALEKAEADKAAAAKKAAEAKAALEKAEAEAKKKNGQ